ncbi:hypothetical protein MIND_00124800 [Mycena indigotica]|uniref:Uncharacterized protein n=1 Tax=Mycena indigotica TaxID=2126181 RepID=A0A8H6WIF4_9AGAR|nr:uncharacterized protein MIND_00124800 [Mycena indigotica]KAF7316068.1 hypothetical protein MIND_00124800 [Mycena indigotica]
MKIIVDDRDPSITYTPVWNTQGNDGLPRSRQQEFEGTTSQPIQSSTNSASFAFTGTRITVFAAVAGLPQGDLEIGIDGRLQRILLPNVSDSSPVFHNPAFDSGPLADGQYTLVMQDVTTGPSVFFFDYMIYETNARGQGQTGFVDDADPSVLFLGSWSQNNTLDFMQHGVHYTGQAGSSFTVSYNFLDGDKLVLFGPLTAADPQFSSALPLSASVSIDGAGPVTLSSQNAPSSGQTLFNQKLYTSSPLAAGQHTFNFSYRSGTPLCVDYFLIEPGSGPVKASNSKSAFPVSITQSPTTGLTWGVPGTSTAIPSPSSATGNYTSHTGAIAS